MTPFSDAPADELDGGRPWFVDALEVAGDPVLEAAPTPEGHVWLITSEGPIDWADEGPGLSCVVVAATVEEAVRVFRHDQDEAEFAWYRQNADGTYWQAVRWEATHRPGWRVYALVQEQVR